MMQLINTNLYKILSYIDKKEKTNFMKIEKRHKFNPTTVRNSLKYLHEQNMIRNTPKIDDKRFIEISLTKRGKMILDNLEEIIKHYL